MRTQWHEADSPERGWLRVWEGADLMAARYQKTWLAAGLRIWPNLPQF